MSVGSALLRIRKERGMTQAQVGRAARVATSYLSRVENGHVQPTMGTLGRVARALGVPVSSVFRVSERGEGEFRHRCPVSASGRCIGEQIRSDHGRRPRRGKAVYGRQEMRILKMADYLALHGSTELRKALLFVLDSFVQQAGGVSDSGPAS